MQPLEERLRSAVAGLAAADASLGKELEAVRARSAGVQLESRLGGLPSGIQLESIALRTGRPVLLVVDDEAQLTFDDAASEVWRSRLQDARVQIGRAIRAVGRIDVENHSLDWVGTGWLVRPDLIVTNRHVAAEFALRRGAAFVFRQTFSGPMSARIDFLEEQGRNEARAFGLVEVLYIEDDPGPDLALVRLEPRGDAALAEPIPLAPASPAPGRQVAAIGYPARDDRCPDQDLMLSIFGDVFDKKRLAPGLVTSVEQGVLIHDCTTLPGGSGSVLLDLESGQAVGLHFGGRFLESNYAVPTAAVQDAIRRIGRA